jgi:hypothetical protein
LFPKNQQGEQYPDLYEEDALKQYSIESVFPGTVAPKGHSTFHANKSRRSEKQPSFVVEVKKKRSFTRPGETPTMRADGEPITKENLFKPRF